MSDDEFLMDDVADEDYDFDYEEDDDEDVDADIENMYYNAKGKRSDDPDGAVADFERVVEKEGQMGDWGFKALKQMTKLNYRRGRHTEALESYTRLLKYTKSAVTRNYSEKSINGILDYVSADSAGGTKQRRQSSAAGGGNETSTASDANAGMDLATMERFYDVTKHALEESKNDRLSVKTDLKLARLWLARGEFGRLSKILKELRAHCTTSDGSDDQSKGTILLEIFALEIQMYGETSNYKKLKETYDATLQIKSAIPHPRIMGIIRECGGKMHMTERKWEAAQIDFFQAFLNYDEAGSPQRIQVLKYLVLAHMLMGSEINPFDSQETKPYKGDPEIVAMTNLVGAYQRREVHEAERILAENQSTILSDAFIRAYIDDVLRGLRTQYLLDLVQPYTRIELSFLARQLNIPVVDVEELIMVLILDGRIAGKIDQVQQRLELRRSSSSTPNSNGSASTASSATPVSSSSSLVERRYAALHRWADEVLRLGTIVEDKHGATSSDALSGARGGSMGLGGSAGINLTRIAMG